MICKDSKEMMENFNINITLFQTTILNRHKIYVTYILLSKYYMNIHAIYFQVCADASNSKIQFIVMNEGFLKINNVMTGSHSNNIDFNKRFI